MRAYGRMVFVLVDILDEITPAEAAQGAAAFGGLPTRIISATKPGDGETAEARTAMDTMHRDLADRDPTAQHLSVPGADHLSLVVQQEHATEVTTAVLHLLEERTAPW